MWAPSPMAVVSHWRAVGSSAFWFRRASGGWAGEGYVGYSAGGGGGFDLVVLVEAFEAVPEAYASAEQDGDHDDVQMVDESGGEEVADDGGTSADAHVLAVGGLAGGFERLGGRGVDEVEGGAALHLD